MQPPEANAGADDPPAARGHLRASLVPEGAVQPPAARCAARVKHDRPLGHRAGVRHRDALITEASREDLFGEVESRSALRYQSCSHRRLSRFSALLLLYAS